MNMKNFFIAIIVIMVSFIVFDCRKEMTVNPPADNYISQLYGSWQWTMTIGGYAPTVRTPQSTGQTAKAIFHSEGFVQYLRNDTLINQFSFTIKKDTSNSLISYLIHYNSTNYYPDQFIGYGGTDTLILVDNCMDCYRTSYVRIRQ